MAHLAAKFAGIAEIEIEDDGIAGLQAQLDDLSSDGFHLVVEEAGDDAAPDGAVFEIELLGPDHPGIVRDISHCLAERGVSVEDMETDIRDAPHAGGTLFHAHARLRAPAGLSDDDLRDSLEILAGTLMVDITVGKIL
ncbi:MAG TPA: glycine cleavage system protein R [Rhodospirillaceae bacterium]|nr:glycine cleavage system protein R [Rhodospirillaceae bacterium]